MIEQLHSHLDVRWLTSYDHQPLALSARRSTVHPNADSSWLHNPDLTGTHMPDLIDFTATLADDAPNQIIGNVNLLCLQLLGWIMTVMWWSRGCSVGVGVARNVCGAANGGWPWGTIRWAVSRISRRRHPFLAFDKNISDIIRCYMNGVRDTCDTQHSLIDEVRKESIL